MKIVQISSHINGAVGKIMRTVHAALRAEGHTSYIFFARGNAPEDEGQERFVSKPEVYTHALLSRLTDSAGKHSRRATKRLVRRLREIDPDVIHLHCLHGYYLHCDTLMRYLAQESRAKIVWTMHDSWAYTGHCCYYDLSGCDRWKTGCHDCPSSRAYPASFTDRSKSNYAWKKKLFTSIPRDRLTVVAPSAWLIGEVQKSFLSDYPTQVIHNGIDLTKYRPTEGAEEQPFILGVANYWDERKGLDTFLALREVLDMDMTLIGLTEEQIAALPAGIRGLARTDTQEELIAYYSTCAVLLIPSKEENYPTVSLEGQACGARVVTFDTGGCKETDCGNLYVAPRDVASLADTVRQVIATPKNPVNYPKMDANTMVQEYLQLYGRSI